MKQVEALMQLGFQNKNTSSIIYSCLECRIALELLDLNKILLSVKPEEKLKIIEESKPKNGIDKLGQKKEILKERYQLFFQAMNEVLCLNSKYYNFKKSKSLQFELSTYIHSYHMADEDLNFDSKNIQNAILLINEVDPFIKSSLIKKNNEYLCVGMEVESLPVEDKKLLIKWKNDFKMDYDELKKNLKKNVISRKK
ncbi:hypothetical protein J1D01_05245 [Seonamhaeicola sp. NFXS20]|uniref:hypothetical protein n=1 Tax=Seonamhaeicola sp. NFXS20 TaxID=2816959 RepID=UPI003B8BC059